MRIWPRLVLALPLVVASGANPALASSQLASKDVRVVNTPADPVPVAATGTVALQPGTTVGVSSTPANPVHVAPPVPPEVFQKEFDLTIPAGGVTANLTINSDIPEGKRLVIEFISGRMDTSPGTVVQFSIRTTVPGNDGDFNLGFVRFPAPGVSLTDTLESYSFRELVRLYADQAILSVQRWGDDSGRASGSVMISGHLVDR